MERKFSVMAAALLFVVALTAPAQTAPPAKKQSPQAGAAGKKSSAHPAAFDRALLRPALLKEKAPEVFDVKFVTTKGDFTLRVTRSWAPLGADRFYNLFKHHFYDGAAFFRVVDGFIAQFGISPYPRVSAAWQRATIKDDSVKQSNLPGTITFATGGPNTRTTQVFLNLKDNSHLDRIGFSPFGKVTEGMVTVVKLYGGYGDSPDRGGTGPDQGKIEKLGKPYLEKGWPKLDSIKTATNVSPSAPAASAPAPPPPKNK